MKMQNGKQVVFLYDGVIPQSGKSVIEFGGYKLCHRSIKKDKSDILVHVDSKIVVRAYPIGADRSVVLDDLATNIVKLKDFIDNPESYEIQERSNLPMKELKPPVGVLNKVSAPHNISYKDVDKPKKKKFNVVKAEW